VRSSSASVGVIGIPWCVSFTVKAPGSARACARTIVVSCIAAGAPYHSGRAEIAMRPPKSMRRSSATSCSGSGRVG
jgi:hypothetical protein